MNGKKTSILRDVIIITVITLVAGALLGMAYNVTKEPIELQRQAKITNAKQAVFPDAADFNMIYSNDGQDAGNSEETGPTKINTVDEALDDGGNVLGYVIDVTNSQGYGGDIELMVGVRTDGEEKLNAISFLKLSETAGMGMKAKNSPFIDQFTGKNVSGGLDISEVDGISGATITTKAVTAAIDEAVKMAEACLKAGGS